MNKLNLFEHQKDAINFILNKKKCALFLEMGLGKTIISLKTVQLFLEKNFVKKVLIIAPLKVANNVWKQELESWKDFKNIKIKICTGNLSERIKNINCDFDILVINIENITWLLDNFLIDWDMLIVDESSLFKNYKSKRFKCLVRKNIDFKSIVLLTGTPCPNNYMDLWSQIYLIDKGKRLEKNITRFKNKFFYKKDFMGYQWELQPLAENKIKTLIQDICLSMKLEDKINLKEKKYYNFYAKFTENIFNIYKDMEKKFIIEINKKFVSAISTATCANKLLQICNGSVYDEKKNIIRIHDEKIKLLKLILNKYKDNNFLIAYNFKSDLILLKKEFPESVLLGREGKELKDWNNKKIKILLAHPKSSCYGLNAYKGGNIIIWYGLTWSLQNYIQFNSRIYRLGQTKNVKIINLIMKGSLDEKIISVLKSKNIKQENLLKKLKKGIL